MELDWQQHKLNVLNFHDLKKKSSVGKKRWKTKFKKCVKSFELYVRFKSFELYVRFLFFNLLIFNFTNHTFVKLCLILFHMSCHWFFTLSSRLWKIVWRIRKKQSKIDSFKSVMKSATVFYDMFLVQFYAVVLNKLWGNCDKAISSWSESANHVTFHRDDDMQLYNLCARTFALDCIKLSFVSGAPSTWQVDCSDTTKYQLRIVSTKEPVIREITVLADLYYLAIYIS